VFMNTIPKQHVYQMALYQPIESAPVIRHWSVPWWEPCDRRGAVFSPVDRRANSIFPVSYIINRRRAQGRTWQKTTRGLYSVSRHGC